MSNLLRKALSEAESLRAVERATGVKRQSMMLFLKSEQSLRLDLADRLIHFFGIKVGGYSVKAHFRNTKSFRQLSLAQMRASIGAMSKHLKAAIGIYEEAVRAGIPSENTKETRR